MSKQAGFTLIELVLVIVILGILAATALPRFANVEDSARRGAFQGVAGAMASAVSVAKAVNRTGTPTPAEVVAQFDGGGDFTAVGTVADAGACPAGPTRVGTAGGNDIYVTSTFGGTTTYCVDFELNAGTLTRPGLN